MGGLPSVGTRRQEPARQKVLLWPSEHTPTRLRACSVTGVGTFQPVHVSILASPLRLLSEESVVGYKPARTGRALCFDTKAMLHCVRHSSTSALPPFLSAVRFTLWVPPSASSPCTRWYPALQSGVGRTRKKVLRQTYTSFRPCPLCCC